MYGAGRRELADGASVGDGFIRYLAMDVTDEDSVKAALGRVLEAEGRLDVLINCAGNGIAGAVEETDAAEALFQFDVNFFGAARVTRLALPVLRKQKSGVIINVSSVGADFALPFQGYYSASKAALNALTDSLRLETRPFGVQAALICPGDTKTGFIGARAYSAGTKASAYKAPLGKAIYAMKRDELGGSEPELIAKATARLLNKKRLPHKVTPGFGYKCVMLAKRLLPYALVEAILRFLYLRKAPDEKIWSFEKDVLGGPTTNLIIIGGGNKMANELYEAILDRRSVRKYQDKPIDAETLKALVKAGMYAPSAKNQQPWRFIIVTEREQLKALHGDIPVWAMLDHAAAAIVVLADTSLLTTPHRSYFLEDCGACAENILLAAHALGLGAVWLGTHPVPEREAHAREVLGLPDDDVIVPFCVIALGYPAALPERPARWDESRVKWERW